MEAHVKKVNIMLSQGANNKAEINRFLIAGVFVVAADLCVYYFLKFLLPKR